MLSPLSRLRRIWRDHIAGPKLRTYDASCEELGGAPWRQVPEATDRWFLADQRPKSLAGAKSGNTDKVPTLDSFVIKKPMSDASKLMLLGGAALTAIALAVVGLVAPPRAASSLPAAVVAPPTAAPASAAPASAAPASAAPASATPVVAAPAAPVVTTRATVAPAPTRPKAATKRRVVVARHRRH